MSLKYLSLVVFKKKLTEQKDKKQLHFRGTFMSVR